MSLGYKLGNLLTDFQIWVETEQLLFFIVHPLVSLVLVSIFSVELIFLESLVSLVIVISVFTVLVFHVMIALLPVISPVLVKIISIPCRISLVYLVSLV